MSYFCVVGHPVTHSKSPYIHAAFAAQTGRRLAYERIAVEPGDLAAAVDEFRAIAGSGMNVTVPLKEEAWALAHERRPRARVAGAANTLWFDPSGNTVVDNTDGAGLVRDLETNHGLTLAGARILLIGAGGAARGVWPSLLAAVPAALLVSNRTHDKAAALAQATDTDIATGVLEWGVAPDRAFDLVINATSLSLLGEVPALAEAAFDETTVCYDMMYGPGPTPFMAWAQQRGVRRVIDGLGMLVEQAALAFELWHGVKPATTPVIEALRAALSGGTPH